MGARKEIYDWKRLPMVDKRIIRRAFSVKRISDGFEIWLIQNLNETKETPSFTDRIHRKGKQFIKRKNYHLVIEEIIDLMRYEYIKKTYTRRQLQEIIVSIRYEGKDV